MVAVALILYAWSVFFLHPPSAEQWGSAMVPFVTAAILLSTFMVNWRTSVVLKTVDVMIHFNKVYDDVAYREHSSLQSDPLAATPARVQQHYRRFWNLQLEQFIMFRKGFIEPDIFRYWMQCRYDEMKANEVVGDMTYKQGWEQASKTLKRTDFEIFMNHVFVDPLDALKKI